MEFSPHKSIYLQIVELIEEKILTGEWKEEERIPSVRQLGVDLEVNPNTVARTFSHLQEHSIIINKRGIGYFVNTDSTTRIKKRLKEAFFKDEMPQVYKKITLLDISWDEVSEWVEKQ